VVPDLKKYASFVENSSLDKIKQKWLHGIYLQASA
jgi:hypothetical protein